MKHLGSDEARRTFRNLLDDAYRGESTEISRNGKPVAILVPSDWHKAALSALRDSGCPLSKEQSALLRAYETAVEAAIPFAVGPDAPKRRRSETTQTTGEQS